MGDFKYYKDQFGEHPEERANNEEMSAAEENFDQIVAMLKDTTASCPVIFNCQAGISRTTTAVVCGALVKELQLTRELDRMRGIVPDDILDALKKKKLGLPGIDSKWRRTGMRCRWESS